jgi:hypothetical protein
MADYSTVQLVIGGPWLVVPGLWLIKCALVF